MLKKQPNETLSHRKNDSRQLNLASSHIRSVSTYLAAKNINRFFFEKKWLLFPRIDCFEETSKINSKIFL